MEYEDRPREIDRRITDALAPDAASIRSVLDRSFKAVPAHKASKRHRRVAIACAATLSVGAAAIWLHQSGSLEPAESGPPTPRSIDTTVTIVGTGTSVVAERSDGLRWFLDERTPAAASEASYIIIVKQEGANK